MTDATVLRSLAYYYLAGLVWLGPPTAVTVLTNDGCGPKLDRLVGLVAEGKLRMPKVSARFKPEEAAKARGPGLSPPGGAHHAPPRPARNEPTPSRI